MSRNYAFEGAAIVDEEKGQPRKEGKATSYSQHFGFEGWSLSGEWASRHTCYGVDEGNGEISRTWCDWNMSTHSEEF
jgi:hypothetical protein